MNNVRDFGAVGDGRVNDTMAIQRAIDAGGTVIIPAGVYLTGTLYLKSNGGLHLESGAELLASSDIRDYNAVDFCPQNWFSKGEGAGGQHLIVAVEQANVSLTGFGTINGNAKALFEKQPLNGAGGILHSLPPWRPAQMVYFCECTNVKICNLNFVDSPYWTCFLHGCQEVRIDGLNIHSSPLVPNDDGIDIDCCSKVTVANCIINSGDDCITLRGDPRLLKTKRPCEYVVVSNCVLRSDYANAMRVGVGNGVCRHCLFQNIVVYDTRTAINLVSKYSDLPDAKGTDIHDIAFRNIEADVARLFVIKHDNQSDGITNHSTATIRNVTISQVNAHDKLTCFVQGNGIGIIENLALSDIRMEVTGTGFAPWQNEAGHWGMESDDIVLEFKNVSSASIKNINLIHRNCEKWSQDFQADKCGLISIENCNFR